MSIVNVNLAPPRAEIVTDTMQFLADGTPAGFTTKFYPVHHARMVLCDQGPRVSAYRLYEHANSMLLPDGIDSWHQQAAEVLPEIHAEFLADYDASDDKQSGRYRPGGWHVYAFGWSPSLRRVIGHAYDLDRAGGFEVFGFNDGVFYQPDPLDPNLAPLKAGDPRVEAITRSHGRALRQFRSPESFIAIAKLQRLAVEDYTGFGVGGALQLCEVTRDAITVRRIYEFPDAAAASQTTRREDAGNALESTDGKLVTA